MYWILKAPFFPRSTTVGGRCVAGLLFVLRSGEGPRGFPRLSAERKRGREMGNEVISVGNLENQVKIWENDGIDSD